MDLGEYVTDLASAGLYGLVGIALLALGYVVIDLLTPGHLGKLILVEQNRNAGIIAVGAMLAVGAITATAIASSDGDLGEGLAESAGYGVIGILLMGVAFVVIDLLTPGRLGDHVTHEEDQPAALLMASTLVAVGAIVAASIS